MLEEDLDDIASPRPIRSVVEGSHPCEVWTINGDPGREQDLEKSDETVRFVVVHGCTVRRVPKDYQSCVCVAQRPLLP